MATASKILSIKRIIKIRNLPRLGALSDEDLFDKANETFTQLQNEGKPFFSLVFSSSNHDPFEFPDGKIELYEQPKATRNNSAKLCGLMPLVISSN